MNDKLSRQNCVLYVCGIVPVVWLALLAAPLLEGGLGTLLEGFGTALENPFHIVWCDKSLKTLLIFLMLYGLGIGVYVSNERVYRRREEQGSARWGNPLSIAKRYQQSGNANKLLTQQVALGLDGRKHHRNLNVLICGGSGAGKTRFYAKPNIMQANTSFVILDPKGELLRDTGHLLEEKGYVIAPIPLSTFAGEPTQSIGKSFLKSYASVCLEGAVIVLACVIFSAFASSPPVVDAGAAAASMVWSYIGELIFNMLILVGSVKMADRVVREMMGL